MPDKIFHVLVLACLIGVFIWSGMGHPVPEYSVQAGVEHYDLKGAMRRLVALEDRPVITPYV